MLSKIREQNLEICVLKISPDVLNLTGVVLSDRNACSSYVRFYDSPDDLENLDFDRIFRKDWRDDNIFVEWENKSIKCAEVLVPDVVLPRYIQGAYVYNREVETKLIDIGFNLSIEVKPTIFF